MIKIDISKEPRMLEMSGDTSTILAELTFIIRSLKESGVDFESIEDTYRVAFLTEDELKKEVMEKLKKILKEHEDDKNKGE